MGSQFVIYPKFRFIFKFSGILSIVSFFNEFYQFKPSESRRATSLKVFYSQLINLNSHVCTPILHNHQITCAEGNTPHYKTVKINRKLTFVILTHFTHSLHPTSVTPYLNRIGTTPELSPTWCQSTCYLPLKTYT